MLQYKLFFITLLLYFYLLYYMKTIVFKIKFEALLQYKRNFF